MYKALTVIIVLTVQTALIDINYKLAELSGYAVLYYMIPLSISFSLLMYVLKSYKPTLTGSAIGAASLGYVCLNILGVIVCLMYDFYAISFNQLTIMQASLTEAVNMAILAIVGAVIGDLILSKEKR